MLSVGHLCLHEPDSFIGSKIPSRMDEGTGETDRLRMATPCPLSDTYKIGLNVCLEGALLTGGLEPLSDSPVYELAIRSFAGPTFRLRAFKSGRSGSAGQGIVNAT